MLGVLGLLLAFVGVIWIGQGLNQPWAPQSFMTSDINWTYRGGGFAAAGAILLLWSSLNGGWRQVLGALGAFCCVLGAFFVLQGTGVLPGMSMSGNMDWTRNGAIVFAVGAVLAFVGSRKA